MYIEKNPSLLCSVCRTAGCNMKCSSCPRPYCSVLCFRSEWEEHRKQHEVNIGAVPSTTYSTPPHISSDLLKGADDTGAYESSQDYERPHVGQPEHRGNDRVNASSKYQRRVGLAFPLPKTEKGRYVTAPFVAGIFFALGSALAFRLLAPRP
eukprot:PhF_6_TR25647/c0_g1_i1/m.36094